MLVAAMFSFTACLDGPGSTGLDVIPENDRLHTLFTDTTTVLMTSIIVDSVDTYRSSRQLFGNYVDPEFGRITAVTYTQVLPRSGLKFSDSSSNLKFDSLVLKLLIDDGYGRREMAQTLHVHELTDTFPLAENISSRSSVAYDGTRDLAGNYQLAFPEGKLGTLSIRLDDALGKRILFAHPDTLADRDLLLQLVKGFRISTDPVSFFNREPGAVFSINSSAEDTRLLLYYQKRDSAHLPFEAAVEPFIIVGVTPRFSQILRSDLDSKLLKMALPDPDTARQYEFIQSGALIKTRISFPHIAQEPIVIQRAELVLKVDPEWLGSDNRFSPPATLNVIAANADGTELVLDDGGFSLVTSPATYDEASQSYSLTITNYLQGAISGQQTNYGFILWPESPTTSVKRVVLGGTQHPFLAPVLKLTYSTLIK